MKPPDGIDPLDWWFVGNSTDFLAFAKDPIVQAWEILRRHSNFPAYARGHAWTDSTHEDIARIITGGNIAATGETWQFNAAKLGKDLSVVDKRRFVWEFRSTLQQAGLFGPSWITSDGNLTLEVFIDCRASWQKAREQLITAWTAQGFPEYGDNCDKSRLRYGDPKLTDSFEASERFWQELPNNPVVKVDFQILHGAWDEKGWAHSADLLSSALRWLHEDCADFRTHRQRMLRRFGRWRGDRSLWPDPKRLACGLLAFDIRRNTQQKLTWLEMRTAELPLELQGFRHSWQDDRKTVIRFLGKNPVQRPKRITRRGRPRKARNVPRVVHWGIGETITDHPKPGESPVKQKERPSFLRTLNECGE